MSSPDTQHETLHLLVAEDDPEMRALLSKVLTREGFSVTTAQHGQDAVDYLRNGVSCDLLITDIRMPGKDGIEVLREARQLRPGLKVVMITAFTDMEIYLEVIREGAFEYLTKPFKIPDLLDVVDRAMASSGGGAASS
ncbi:MAG: response regulator [Sumerlaeia bacterium]